MKPLVFGVANLSTELGVIETMGPDATGKLQILSAALIEPGSEGQVTLYPGCFIRLGHPTAEQRLAGHRVDAPHGVPVENLGR
jgi:hypothetical protein